MLLSAVLGRAGGAHLQFSCAAEGATQEEPPERPPFPSSPQQPCSASDPAPHRFWLHARSQGQRGWCWGRSPPLKKWKRNEPAAVRCPLVPHRLNPGCQKAAQKESHFKKQLTEIKSNCSTITNSEIQVLLWSCPNTDTQWSFSHYGILLNSSTLSKNK